ncbi:hypothetical protein TCA2_4407 [Paenibacillus sp. TCA20]|uniref:hypothetical protein n=1 Tax=Paenibacillus sp. TCA20 TaxID=1499968 RepID=UPI0004D5ECAC|nr:hypothetical protein [Paenibacillus sp. TCA20]GAK41915.1 hypothetical protein TCA2_4407 [Paenibacillus sp. TCA20]
MAKAKKRQDLYQIDRFLPEQLMKMQSSIYEYAKAISGLPSNHSEVFEKRGWLLPFLFSYDDLLWGRWNYWHEILQKKTIKGSGPIPQIEWKERGGEGVEETQKMLRKCLDHHESTIDHFADWLMWGLAASPENQTLKISPELNEHYYREFDIFLVQNYPTDYLSHTLSEETGKGYKSGLGYFPTPFNITCMMTQMTMGGDPEEEKRQTVYDGCVGCGATILPASNHTLRMIAQDISQIAVKLCKIQTYWYAPWYAFHPQWLKGFEQSKTISLVPATPGKKVLEGQLAFDLDWATAPV